MSKDKIVDEKFSEDGKPVSKQGIEQNNIAQALNDLPTEILRSSPYEIRDTYYSQILSNYNTEYVNRRKQIKGMRTWMFWIMISLLVAVVISSVVLFFIIICNGVEDTTSIVALITVGISFISTILTIPIIIARSLFPEKEDSQIIEVLTKLIENDDNIRKNTLNAINSNETKMPGQ